jgi:hypothetical protein
MLYNVAVGQVMSEYLDFTRQSTSTNAMHSYIMHNLHYVILETYSLVK